ncbi:MAG: NYN domain-containing protein [Candidatus Kaelpia imicola]|nr:NYN domain-containing protein [Candidatus Kaelpia imicola]
MKLKKRIICLVDGFNLYHALADNLAYRKFKWLNLRKLCESFISDDEVVENIFYFSAYARWDPKKVARHKIYIEALQLVNVQSILSEFKHKDKRCRKCGKIYKTYEEKQTDVRIAITLFQKAIDDKFDKAIIISADSDLIPAIEAVKGMFLAKEIKLLIPITRRAEALKIAVDNYSKIKTKHLASCQFDDSIILSSGKVITRPAEWY